MTEVGDYVFRTCFIDPFQGAVMARFAREELKAKRVAILFDFKQDYSVGLADFFRKTFNELGGEIVADERYTSGDIEFRAQLTTIRAANARRGLRARLLHGGGPDREAGPRARASTCRCSAATAGTRRRPSRSAAPRSRATTSRTTTRPTPTARRCRTSSSSYQEQHGEVPDAMAALGYDAAGILADAITRAGDVAGRRRCATRSPRPRTTTASPARISIDEDRNARKDAVVLKIEGGQFRFYRSVPAS